MKFQIRKIINALVGKQRYSFLLILGFLSHLQLAPFDFENYFLHVLD